MPVERTIKKYVAEAKRSSEVDADPWRIEDADPADVAAVVRVIAAVVERTGGRVRGVSKQEAKLIVRINAAVPSATPTPRLDPWDTYRLARRLIASPEDEAEILLYLGTQSFGDVRRYADLAGRDPIGPPYDEGDQR